MLTPTIIGTPIAASIASALLLASAVVHAARSCPLPSPLPPVRWTLSEFSYSAPDPSTPVGRAGTDSTIGLSLINNATAFSCYGSWPAEWDGWADEGRSLISFNCVVDGPGQMLDTTVSVAVDWWKKGNTPLVYIEHTYVCADGEKKGKKVHGLVSTRLDLECQPFESPGDNKPSRCIMRSEHRQTLTTWPRYVEPRLTTNSSCARLLVPEISGWQVRGFASLPGGASGRSGNTEEEALKWPLMVHSFSDNSVFQFPVWKTIVDKNTGLVQGSSTPVNSDALANATASKLTFSFDPEARLIILVQTQRVPCRLSGSGNGTSVVEFITRGAGHAPLNPCLSSSSPTCYEEAVFWVGAHTERVE